MGVAVEMKPSGIDIFHAVPIVHSGKPMEDKKIQNIVFAIFAEIANFFYQIFHRIIGLAILPSQVISLFLSEKIRKKRALFKERFACEEIQVKTADHIVLDGMYIPGKECVQSDRTVILFNPNGLCFEDYGDISMLFDLELFNQRELLDKGWNIVLFNYRGVGQNKGMATRDGLISDGEAFFQYVRDRLGVPENKILLHGHSLGAAIASEVAANHPNANYCNDRSFISLSKQVKVMFGNGRLGEWLSKLLIYFGWEFNVRDNLDKIKGKKFAVFNLRDGVIPPGARFYESLGIEEKDWMEHGLIEMFSHVVNFKDRRVCDSAEDIEYMLLHDALSKSEYKAFHSMKDHVGQIAHMRRYSSSEEFHYLIEIDDI